MDKSEDLTWDMLTKPMPPREFHFDHDKQYKLASEVCFSETVLSKFPKYITKYALKAVDYNLRRPSIKSVQNQFWYNEYIITNAMKYFKVHTVNNSTINEVDFDVISFVLKQDYYTYIKNNNDYLSIDFYVDYPKERVYINRKWYSYGDITNDVDVFHVDWEADLHYVKESVRWQRRYA